MRRMLLSALCALVMLLVAAPASAEPIYSVSRKELSVNTALSKDVQNILMLMQDKQSGESSSAMLVASINKQNGRAVMVSLTPNVLVNMPLAGEQPLGDAYLLGGVNLAMKAVNETYGLNIERYAVLDVGGFGEIVQTVGGIELSLSASEAAALGLPEGVAMLNGEQTMQYMRMQGGDASVNRPYQCVMQLLYRATRDKDPGKLMSLGGKLLGALEDTNLGVFDLIGLATPVMSSKEARGELTLPAAETLVPVEWNGRAMYATDVEVAKKLLHETLY